MGTRGKIIFTLALALALGLVGYSLIGPQGGKQVLLQTELTQLLEANRRLVEENRRLGLEIDGLKTRRDYQEKVARDELGLVKSDEVMIHLPDPPKKQDSGRLQESP